MFLRFVLVLSVCNLCCHGELYTSLHHMKKAVRRDSVHFYDAMDVFVKAQTRKLSEIKRILVNLKTHHSKLKYLPVLDDNFKIYKKFLAAFNDKWRQLEDLFYNPESDDLRSEILQYRLKLPSHEDKIGLMDSIIISQMIYNINITEWTSGYLLGRKTTPLSAKDCFTFGRRMFLKSKEVMSLIWFDAALDKLMLDPLQSHGKVRDLDGVERNLTRDVVMSARALAMHSNEIKLDVLKKLAPRNTIGMDQRSTLNINKKMKRREIKNTGFDIKWNLGQMTLYSELCQGLHERNLTGEDFKDIRCYYAVHTNPFYLLRRIKVEMVNLSPLIFILHDVVYNSEIKAMKKEVTGEMIRSKVSRRNVADNSSTRVSVRKHLKENSIIASRLNNKVMALMNLNMTRGNVDEYKVINYGPAGLFGPHLDYYTGDAARVAQKSVSGKNRLFTLITYMSEVQYGGSTVFTKLNITISPVRGSILIFQNLKENGTGDNRTVHASCPVIFGNKWIVTKYVHDKGQDLSQIKRLVNS